MLMSGQHTASVGNIIILDNDNDNMITIILMILIDNDHGN